MARKEKEIEITETTSTIVETSEIYNVYNIVNKITSQRNLFYAQNETQGLRIFNTSANANANNIPEDFQLELVGTWNIITGELTSQKPQLVANGKYIAQLQGELKTLIEKVVMEKVETLLEKKGITND